MFRVSLTCIPSWADAVVLDTPCEVSAREVAHAYVHTLFEGAGPPRMVQVAVSCRCTSCRGVGKVPRPCYKCAGKGGEGIPCDRCAGRGTMPTKCKACLGEGWTHVDTWYELSPTAKHVLAHGPPRRQEGGETVFV